ncbi:MAG: kinase, partial [Gammaproteobacteria bacterium]|nr:kinase [Gammaproteobacteria bacterium]
VNGKVDIVILEGWCVGAKPQTAAELIEAINSLEAKEDSEAIWRTCSNNVLAIGYQKLFGLLDMLIMLKVTDFSLVHQHRLQQEEELARKTNHPAMNKSEIARFVAHYQRLTEAILKEMPARADLVLEVDAAHSYTLRD